MCGQVRREQFEQTRHLHGLNASVSLQFCFLLKESLDSCKKGGRFPSSLSRKPLILFKSQPSV